MRWLGSIIDSMAKTLRRLQEMVDREAVVHGVANRHDLATEQQ